MEKYTCPECGGSGELRCEDCYGHGNSAANSVTVTDAMTVAVKVPLNAMCAEAVAAKNVSCVAGPVLSVSRRVAVNSHFTGDK